MCELCRLPSKYSRAVLEDTMDALDVEARNGAINRLARARAKSLPAGELLRGAGEPFSEDEILAEMSREDEILRDCE